MRTLTGLAWRNLMQRKLRTLLSVIGVALGVALVFAAASVGIAATNETSAAQSERLDMQVISSNGTYVDAALVDTARAVSGIAAVSPVLTMAGVSSTNAAATLTLRGVDPVADAQIRNRVVVEGQALSGDGQIVVPAVWATQHKIAVGDTLVMLVATAPGQLPAVIRIKVVGLLQEPAHGGLSEEGLTTLDALQHATGLTGKLSLLEIRYADGVDADSMAVKLKDALGESVSLVGGAGFSGSAILNVTVNIVLAMAGCVILLTAAYLIFNTFAMTLAERRADIGRLIALGMTPEQASRSILTEAAFIGGMGSLAGLLLGAVMTVPVRLLVDSMTSKPFQLVPLSPIAGIVGLAMGLGITLATTLPIARQAGRVSPLEMIFSQRQGPTRSSHRATQIAVAILIGSVILIAIPLLAPNTNESSLSWLLRVLSLGQMGLLLGLLLIVPDALTIWFKILRRRVGMRLGLGASLALSNLERQPARAALTASALTIVVAATIMVASLSSTLGNDAPGLIQAVLNPDYLLLPGGGEGTNPLTALISGKMFMPTDPAFYTALDTLRPQMTISHWAFVSIPETIVMPGFPGSMTVDIGDFIEQRGSPLLGATNDEIRATFAAGPAVIVSQPVADRFKLKIGDSLTVHTSRGPATFKVAAVDQRLFYSYFDYKQAQTTFGSVQTLAMAVKRRSGVGLTDVEPTLQTFAKQFGLQLVNMSDYLAANAGLYSSLTAVFSAIGLLTMIVAAVGILATMVTSVTERRHELGILSAVGGTPAQLRNMVLLESIVIGVSGAIPGALIGLVSGGMTGPLNALNDKAMNVHIYPGDIVIAWMPLIVALLGAPLIALVAALLPAQQAINLRVVEALRYQ